MWIIHNKELFCLTLDDPLHVKNILCNKTTTTTSKHYRESALMTAVHIMICLIKGEVVKKSLGTLMIIWNWYMFG